MLTEMFIYNYQSNNNLCLYQTYLIFIVQVISDGLSSLLQTDFMTEGTQSAYVLGQVEQVPWHYHWDIVPFMLSEVKLLIFKAVFNFLTG